MAKNDCIVVKVTKNQYERVKNNAEAKGHKTISSYIRSLALENDSGFERKLNAVYDKIVNNSGEANS